MTPFAAAHGVGTVVGIALYVGLAALALWWATRMADPERPPRGDSSSGRS